MSLTLVFGLAFPCASAIVGQGKPRVDFYDEDKAIRAPRDILRASVIPIPMPFPVSGNRVARNAHYQGVTDVRYFMLPEAPVYDMFNDPNNVGKNRQAHFQGH